jgi:2-polyprenyl-6-hydroxyphenyl methylase / 3-demethylubiquinone-9 3-methyltransferase
VIEEDASSIARATANADRLGLHTNIKFVAGSVQSIDLGEAAFSVVFAQNTFEHIDDKTANLKALSRVVQPQGLVIFDTISQSTIAKVIYLGAFQAFPLTSIVKPGTYVDARFIKPKDLQALAIHEGFELESVQGFQPRSILSLVLATIGRKLGTVKDAELANRASMILSESKAEPAVTYFGTLTKRLYK